MSYDCIIIGGGISGLTCGIKCAGAGLRCIIYSAGMSALHFSSGSIDVLGYDASGNRVRNPFEELGGFIDANPDHPYAKCGTELVQEAVSFFRDEAEKEAFHLFSKGNENHAHITTLGTLKPTYLSQRSVFNERLQEKVTGKPKIALLNLEAFKDFYPSITAANLANTGLFRDCEIVATSVDLSDVYREGDNPYDYRSIDIARLFDRSALLDEIAARINKAAAGADIVGLPAFIGFRRYNQVFEELQSRVNGVLYEIPTLPPSILGIRLDNALKSRFAALGGVYIAGDRVVGGEIRDGQLLNIVTANHRDFKLGARFFVLSTGSFFSGGLASDVNGMREPVFGLSIQHTSDRASWYAPSFFQKESHPFLRFGVKTDEKLNPFDDAGSRIENLFCTGAVLASYSPVVEASGSGVAISTGYLAAKQILEQSGKTTVERE